MLGYFATVHNSGLTGLLAQTGAVSAPVVALTVAVCPAGGAAAMAVRGVSPFAPPLVLLCTAALASPLTWLHHWIALPLLLCLAAQTTARRGMRWLMMALLVMQLLGSVYFAYAFRTTAPSAGSSPLRRLWRPWRASSRSSSRLRPAGEHSAMSVLGRRQRPWFAR